MNDSFDAFLMRQRSRCYGKAAASLTRLRKKRQAAALLAEEVVTVKGSYGGGPSTRIDHDDGIEWTVRQKNAEVA